MDNRDWGKFLLPYDQAVEELKVKFKTLRTELKVREQFSPIEFVTGRVKRISSILEKARRLDVPMDQLETGIEDIAGIRLMTQFVQDIEWLADLIRERKDITVVYEKDYVNNKKESGYRSYHIIVEYPVQTALGVKPLLAEIQIRTLAMNFWATIEHSLNYKYKQSLPEPLYKRLQAAAEAAFQLDQDMSTIRDEIMQAQMLFEDRSNMVSALLNEIQELYFYNMVKEATDFQARMNDLLEMDENWKLKSLSLEIQQTLLSAKNNKME